MRRAGWRNLDELSLGGNVAPGRRGRIDDIGIFTRFAGYERGTETGLGYGRGLLVRFDFFYPRTADWYLRDENNALSYGHDSGGVLMRGIYDNFILYGYL